MRTCSFLLILTAILLTACASDSEVDQGSPKSDFSASDDLAVKTSYAQASTIKLGTYQDLDDIKAAIKRDNADMTVKEIRWTSADTVIVYAAWYHDAQPTGFYYYTVVKEDTGWRVTARYLDSIG